MLKKSDELLWSKICNDYKYLVENEYSDKNYPRCEDNTSFELPKISLSDKSYLWYFTCNSTDTRLLDTYHLTRYLPYKKHFYYEGDADQS